MNGKCGPIMFVHIILYELNSKYAFRVSKLLTDMILKRKIEIISNDNYEFKDKMKGGSKINEIKSKNVKNSMALSLIDFNPF